jgi:hypothetical protein
VGRGWGLAYAAVAGLAIAVAVVVGVRMLLGSAIGDVDPLGAVVALASLSVSVASMYLSVRAVRRQELDSTDLVGWLAEQVTDAEGQARRQLLGGHDKPIDVDFDFQPAGTHNAANAARRGHLQDVVSYYRRLRPRRMVITGTPGSGKTVLAVELILELLAQRGPDDPVPVRLSAAGWNPDTAEPVDAWLTTHLVDTYHLAPAAARSLITAQKILPVIDGLDEMDAATDPGYGSRAGRALTALNAYQQRRTRAELVLTCRSEQYQALAAAKVWVHDAARVQIRQLTAAKARAFITSRVIDSGRWQPVLDTIARRPGAALAQGLSTPWRLTLAVTGYEQRDRNGAFLRDPARLCDASLASPEAVRDHLLALFIPAATALYTDPRAASYQPEHVHRWLAVLAGYLDRNTTTGRTLGGRTLSGTDILLHELWPLAGLRRPRLMSVVVLAAIWLIATPVMLTQVSIGFAPNQLFGAIVPALGVCWGGYEAWSVIWPEPTRADLQQLRTWRGRRRLASVTSIGLAGGVVVTSVIEYIIGVTGGHTLSPGATVAVGVAAGLTSGLTIGVAVDGRVGTRDPRATIRNDLAIGLGVGLVMGLGLGLVVGLVVRLMFGLIGGLALGLTFGLTVGPTGGLAGFRYVALLLCTRRWSGQWLPWRLGRMLNWCYHAGLIRIAGIGYQFRHRELQDYLARNPAP